MNVRIPVSVVHLVIMFSQLLALKDCYSSTFSFKTRPTNRLYMVRAKVLTAPSGRGLQRIAAVRGVSRPPQVPGLLIGGQILETKYT